MKTAASMTGEHVRVPELILAMPPFPPYVIREFLFERCTIEGPAVLAIGRTVQLTSSQFDVGGGTIDSIIWEVPDGVPINGVVGLEAVAFEHCRFVNIAFACSAEIAAELRTTPMTRP